MNSRIEVNCRTSFGLQFTTVSNHFDIINKFFIMYSIPFLRSCDDKHSNLEMPIN